MDQSKKRPEDWYVEKALAQIPRVLTLVDRDPSSPTYGCFDRNYWHYRTQDFPSGMYQELALPLAQVSAFDLPGNPWKGQARVRELAIAGVSYSARSAHADGSCDDYYPHERALGATAFAAASAASALMILDHREPALLSFLERRSRWLLGHEESGQLSNHQALVALAAARTAALTGDRSLLDGARERLELCLSWQHEEGWFAEYEGADPGYQTLTLSFLAALREHLASEELNEALARAARFAAYFLHPDGSYAGETGSRNTCQVLPSGFERLAPTIPEAAFLADGWLAGAIAGKGGYADDDRIFSHWLQDVIEAYRARCGSPGREGKPRWTPPRGRTSFAAAGLHVIREGDVQLVVATRKGGVFRAYRGPRLLRNDTGLVAVTENGARWVSHGVDRNANVTWDKDRVILTGRFQKAPRLLATPLRQIAFRSIHGTMGRLAPDLVRRLLQRALITGKRSTALRFEREIRWGDGVGVEVIDRVVAEKPSARSLTKLYASTDATSIYVATSNLWQEASLEAWEPLPFAVDQLRDSGRCEVIRRYS